MKRTIIATLVTSMTFAGAVVLPETAYAASFNMQKETIMVQNNIVSQPYGFVDSGTTYMPLWYVMQALNSIGVQNTWTGTQWNIQVSWTGQVFPLNAGSDSHFISINSGKFAGFKAMVTNDPSSNQPTTFIPVWYVMQALNAIDVENTWDGHTWRVGRVTWGAIP